jgi:hypothetical protein
MPYIVSVDVTPLSLTYVIVSKRTKPLLKLNAF